MTIDNVEGAKERAEHQRRAGDRWPLPGTAPIKPDSLQFRNAMSRLGASVHIVTTNGAGGLAGITASAVTSVSDDPATMLVCMNRASLSAPRFVANGVFCINTLATEDEQLANDFAGRTGLHLDARFGRGLWERLATGAPVLETAIAVFDCRIIDLRDVSTHHVMIGEVLAVRFDAKGACLGYHDRHFMTF